MEPYNDKYNRVRQLIREERRRQPPMRVMFLSRLNGRPADKRSANKFLLGCILDYQMKVGVVWESARRFAEDDLEDPRDLWREIIAIPRLNTPAVRRRYTLHRFPAAHARVQRIGRQIVSRYAGDARNIWKNQSPCVTQERLEQMGVGPQLSRMTAGALHDSKQIVGAGELKADIHVRRVLGRVFTGDMFSAATALSIANEMMPRGSWKLDASCSVWENPPARKQIRTAEAAFSAPSADSAQVHAVEKPLVVVWRTRFGRLRLQLTCLLTDTPMRHDFNIDHLHRILAGCPEYEADHHLDRPFMSAYQIAIRFAEEHPDHDLVRTLPLGGEGTGTNQNLAQRIARFLSQAIHDGTAGDIEGGFISHACVDDFCFRYRGRRVRVSTLRTAHAHSIFRVPRAASDRPS